jgi:hypothetical protein
MSLNKDEKQFLQEVAAAIVQSNQALAAYLEKLHEERMRRMKIIERCTLIGFFWWILVDTPVYLYKLASRSLRQRAAARKVREAGAIPLEGTVKA